MFDHEIKCALCLAVRVEAHDFPPECNAAEVCGGCLDTIAALDRRRRVRLRAGVLLQQAWVEFTRYLPTAAEAVAGARRAFGGAAA